MPGKVANSNNTVISSSKISESKMLEIEKKLKKEAIKKARQHKLKITEKYGSIKEAENAYVYGTKRKLGWKPNKK